MTVYLFDERGRLARLAVRLLVRARVLAPVTIATLDGLARAPLYPAPVVYLTADEVAAPFRDMVN